MSASLAAPGRFRRPLARLGLAVLLLGAAAGTPDARGEAEDTSPPVLHVDLQTEGAYRSIQEAVDAAPAGAIILIAPGHYVEHVRVAKALTLAGAVADGSRATKASETRVSSILYRSCQMRELRRSYAPRLGRARSERDRRRLWRELKRKEARLIRPTVRVREARGVVLRDLTLQGLGKPEGGTIGHGEVVSVEGAGATIERCRVVGSPGCGVRLIQGADVELSHCLIAATWDRGIVVGGDDAPAARARVSACDVRSCYGGGIGIMKGNVDAVVEQCWISGSNWYGVRYDDASPTIRGNRIHHNARGGIYASGSTSAAVAGNLLHENGDAGMTCWYANADRVTRNTFVDNAEEGLAVYGPGQPTVEANVFAEEPFGIFTAPVDATTAPPTAAPFPVRLNVFWRCEHNLALGPLAAGGPAEGAGAFRDLALAPADGNRELALEFVDARGDDYRFAPGSVAALAGAGAGTFPPAASPWPLQPEEAEMRSALEQSCSGRGVGEGDPAPATE